MMKMRFGFIIIILLMLLAIAYGGWRIYCIIPLSILWKIAAVTLYILCFGCFIFSFTGRLDRLPMSLASALYVIGNTWLIFLMYTLIAAVLADILRLVRVLPAAYLKDSVVGASAFFGAIIILFIYGGLHYHHKYRKEITITSSKVTRPVKAVLMSDLHIGYLNDRAELSRWVDLVNAEKPDLVLIGGDIIDRSVRPLIEEGCADEFRRLEAPVYACLGNHEYISGIPGAETFYRDAGIGLLKDAVADFAPEIAIIGRDDAANRERKPLQELIAEIPEGRFKLLLDHQPNHLEDAENAGIDFQFSGHTHHGQVWPISWVTDLIFEDAYGTLKKGSTEYYVTSGIGIWGAGLRIGTRSEWVVLNIEPAGNNEAI